MKSGKLIECNMRNIFLTKSYTICGGETIPRSFSTKSELSTSVDHYSKDFMQFTIIACKLRAIKIY